MSNPIYKSIQDQLPGLTYYRAAGHVFKLIHVNYVETLAWCPDKRWTQFRNGKVYTYNEAVDASIKGEIPELGRWYAIGKLIYSVE